ncbi:uncharacterized protein KY384_004991 [Bacidia gigantensis]|uniref:uncharacterized protein n=1 Tax=Bacidia gigantensis TaxID=2732470 RepID=UPI001D0566B7|nr:uncharacterized protein KY384_004991 [Bacidia gigantensis]KAG8530488.1 hypothetical protein KY384_004991 [Bacidia gigantensis]
MPPCSLQDYLDYLTYVSHDAENLQFYLWMVDYFQRFRSIPKYERALSPRWTGRAPPIREQNGLRMIATHDIDVMSEDISDCDTWGGADYQQSEFTDEYTQTLGDIKFSISPVKSTGLRRDEQFVWHPAEAQPLRNEITRIVNHYIAPGSPRQLNLSHNDRATVLRALEYTTHPSALSPIKRMLDSTLRNHSHPNFIRWSLTNGTRQWKWFLRIFSASLIVIGSLIAIILACSSASRFFRIFALPFWWFGITNVICGTQGLCIILHQMHTRQYHAWEIKTKDFYLFDEEEMGLKGDYGGPGNISYESTRPSWPVKMEVFGPANNYSGEQWVAAWQRRPWYKKLFQHRVKVQDEGLRQMQTTMVRSAELWALAIAVPITIAFVAIPVGNKF